MTITARRTVLRVRIAEGWASEGRVAEVEYKESATVTELCAEVVSLLAGDRDADGYLLSVADGAVLPATATVASCQLLDGELLRLVDATDNPPLRPVLSDADDFRVVHESGPQLGFAWPIGGAEPLLLELASGRLHPVADAERPDVELSVDVSGQWVVASARPGVALAVDGVPVAGHLAQVRSGSLLGVSRQSQAVDHEDYGDALDVEVRVVTRRLHELVRNRLGRANYRVRGIDSQQALPAPVSISLKEAPSSEIGSERAILGEILLDELPMLAMYILIVTRVSFAWYLGFYFLIPALRIWQRLRQHRKRVRDSEAKHALWKERTLEDLGILRSQAEQYAAALKDRHSTPHDLWPTVQSRSMRLWSFLPETDGFLTVCVGSGDFVYPGIASVPGSLTQQEQNEWRQYAASSRVVADAPMVLDLGPDHLAVLGSTAARDGVLRAVVARMAVSHSPADLHLVALLPASDEGLGWAQQLQWLPHFRTSASLFPATRICFGPEEAEAALQAARASLERTAESTGEVLLLVHEAAGAPLGLFEDYLDAADGHAHVLWVGSSRTLLPAFVANGLEVGDGPGSSALKGRAGSTVVTLDRLSERDFEQILIGLAPLVDESERAASATLPRWVPLGAICDPKVEGATYDSSGALIAAVGESVSGVQEIDLVSSGPHVLIAGTTGAGKSELLRTLVLSLASRYAPTNLAFIFIDFKGGASLQDLAALPHHVGSADNLDAAGADRLLRFLSAEIARRQRRLRKYGGDYLTYRQAPGAKADLPRLLIVIDEFGALMAGGSGQKERSQSLMSVAARGRSLGVHLVLATQSPKNDVSQEIRVNVNGRLSLRVLEASESMAVLGDDVAASIPKSLAGRVVARLDSGGELLQFQSALTKARTLAVAAADKSVELRALGFVRATDRGTQQLDPKVETDGAVIVSQLAEASSDLELDQPLLRDPLSEIDEMPAWAELDLLHASSDGGDIDIVFGLRDDPDSQRQVQEVLNLREGSVSVAGGSLSGRSTLLANVARQLLSTGRQEAVVILDWGGAGPAGPLHRVVDAFTATGRLHYHADPTAADMDLLIKQLGEDYSDQDRDVASTVLLIDRLDNGLYSIGPRLLPHLIQIIASGARNRIGVVATVDSRVAVDEDLRRAFSRRYRLRDGRSFILLDDTDAEIKSLPAQAIRRSLAYVTQWRRPLGETSKDTVQQMESDDSRGIFVGVDQVRHEAVYLSPTPGISVVGTPGSGRTAVLLSICHAVAMRTGEPVPIMSSLDVDDCDWLKDLSVIFRTSAPLAEHYIQRLRDLRQDRPGYLAIDDLNGIDDTDRRLLEMGVHEPAVLRKALATYVDERDSRLFAAGSPGMLLGRSAQQNGLSDRLHFAHRNFVVLQPVSAELMIDDRVTPIVKTLVSGRDGHRYAPEAGVAVCGPRKYDFVASVPDEVKRVLSKQVRTGVTW